MTKKYQLLNCYGARVRHVRSGWAQGLYGCIESARLWYEDLLSFLIEEGFTRSEHDECLFVKDQDGEQIEVIIYVDDFMITCKDEEKIRQLERKLRLQYKDLRSNYGSVQKYLGMTFDFSIDGKVTISMPEYIEKLLQEYKVTQTASLPAEDDLFIERDPKIVRNSYIQLSQNSYMFPNEPDLTYHLQSII